MGVVLPTYEDCEAAAKQKRATALHRFILDNEPAGSENERAFREVLEAMLAECTANAQAAAMEAADEF